MEAFFFSNSPLKQAEFNYFHVKYKETKAKELVFEIMKQEEKRVIIFRILLRIQRLRRVALAVRLKKKKKEKWQLSCLQDERLRSFTCNMVIRDGRF